MYAINQDYRQEWADMTSSLYNKYINAWQKYNSEDASEYSMNSTSHKIQIKLAIGECMTTSTNEPVLLVIDPGKVEFLVGKSWIPLFKAIIFHTSLNIMHDTLYEMHKVLVHKDTLPEWECMFGWTLCTRFQDVKGFLIGEDDFYKDSDGLCYSRKSGAKSDSLNMLFATLCNQGVINHIPQHGSLRKWAQQGLVLINKTGCYDPVNTRSWILNLIVSTVIEQVLYHVTTKPLTIISVGKAISWNALWTYMEDKYKIQNKNGSPYLHTVISVPSLEKFTQDVCKHLKIDWNLL